MKHPITVWVDTDFAETPVRKLREEYRRHIGTGPNKLAVKTQRKYLQDLDDFIGSLERRGIEPVLEAVTPDAVNAWVEEQEARGNKPHSIQSRVISLKTFTSRFILKVQELTTVDLLRKVARPDPKDPQREGLSAEEVEWLLEAFGSETYEDVRDRAILATFLATGLRFDAVRTLPLSSYDRVTGEFRVCEKGDMDRQAQLGAKARKAVNAYLARRPKNAATDQVWVTDRGTPLTYDGMATVFRRARERSGIAHLLRHGMAQHAADEGADIGTIQTLLGHKTAAMARRYAGEALNRQGARLMVQYSPLQ